MNPGQRLRTIRNVFGRTVQPVAGIPDVIACINGRFVAFEVKTETGKLTKLQEITIQKIRNAKGQAFKVTSAAEVAAILKELEVMPYE